MLATKGKKLKYLSSILTFLKRNMYLQYNKGVYIYIYIYIYILFHLTFFATNYSPLVPASNSLIDIVKLLKRKGLELEGGVA